MNTPRPALVQLLTRMNVGGPARHVHALSDSLAGRYRWIVAAGIPPASEGCLTDDAVRVRPLPLRREVAPRADLQALRAVRRLLREERVALVNTHMAKAGAVGRLAASSIRPRPVTVHTFHGHVLDGYFGRTATTAILRAERWLAQRTDALVAVSARTRDQLLELGVGRPEQWHVIPVAVDLEPYLAAEPGDGPLRRELGLADADLLVGVVGRLAPIKEPETALDAVADLPGVQLVFVGDGPLREHLVARARALGMAGRVHFLGWRADVGAVLRSLDVALLTSRNEGTPTVLMEAAASGCPVVATDVGGVRAIVEDGQTGILVPPGDPGAVAQALRRLQDNPSLRAEMRAAGRTRAAAHFDVRRTAEQTHELYAHLLATGSRRVR